MATRSRTQSSEIGQGLFVEPGMLAEVVRTAVQAALEEQVAAHLGAQPYQRTSGRSGHRNGYKPRRMQTAVGTVDFQVPQVREGGFRPTVFERFQRSDKALVSAMQEMVVCGVSTRQVGSVLEAMAGFEVSAATVSRAMSDLDEQIRGFRERALGDREWPYLIIDARYERIRNSAGKVVRQAVLVVAGIDDEGRREILSYAVADSESEASWGAVFSDLKRRGVRGVELVTSDAHKGIQAALARHYQGVAWQRCRVHLMRELLNKVSWRDRKELAADLRAIFVSDDPQRCMAVAEEIAEKWNSRAAKMSAALREGIEDCLTVQSKPSQLRRRLHSTNMLERLMRTLKDRTRKVLIFPNEASCARLVGALLIEKQEDWQSEERRYLNLDLKE